MGIELPSPPALFMEVNDSWGDEMRIEAKGLFK
jgi:hypothetical protein